MSTRSAPKIAAFIHEQLGDLPTTPNPSPEVQWVSFTPPRSIRGERQMNGEDYITRDADRSHGFAFVTLREPKLAETILLSWPWEHSTSEASDADASTADARRVGFRTLSV